MRKEAKHTKTKKSPMMTMEKLDVANKKSELNLSRPKMSKRVSVALKQREKMTKRLLVVLKQKKTSPGRNQKNHLWLYQGN